MMTYCFPVKMEALMPSVMTWVTSLRGRSIHQLVLDSSPSQINPINKNGGITRLAELNDARIAQ